MKFVRSVALAFAGALVFGMPALAAQYTLSVNSANPPDDPLFEGLEAFRAAVAERTDGAVEVRLYPNSQLGSDEDVLEQARSGAPVAVLTDAGRLALFQEEFGVLGAPYLTSNHEELRKVVTSALFEEWVQKLRASDLQILSFNWWQGTRHLFTKKPITTPADLAGVRMRTPGAPVWVETVKAMGATPSPMPYAEVYPALEQHVIDATESQYPAAWGSRFYEVTSYVTKTGHFSLGTGLITSSAWFDSLPAEYQAILREEALKAGDIASRGTAASLIEIEEKLKAAGMTVSEIDVTPFRKATEVVYEKLGYVKLREAIQKISGE